MNEIKMILKDETYVIELYDTTASEVLYDSLPQTISMSKWGGEYYGGFESRIPGNMDQKKQIFEEGEVALWPDGNAFCIFFGPTPVSTDGRPKMASPGVALGKIVSEDYDFFYKFGSGIEVELTK